MGVAEPEETAAEGEEATAEETAAENEATADEAAADEAAGVLEEATSEDAVTPGNGEVSATEAGVEDSTALEGTKVVIGGHQVIVLVTTSWVVAPG